MESKIAIINKHKINDQDTGSIEVQVALLSHRIDEINKHFKIHKKDYTAQTGLMKLVGQRRRFLNYLKRHRQPAYKSLIDQLDLRG
ncbi:MAG: 30S ribosomal protein S15 [Candidatus Babeliaceae bacterium]|jgi:small subunit ribosomal protein S15